MALSEKFGLLKKKKHGQKPRFPHQMATVGLPVRYTRSIHGLMTAPMASCPSFNDIREIYNQLPCIYGWNGALLCC